MDLQDLLVEKASYDFSNHKREYLGQHPSQRKRDHTCQTSNENINKESHRILRVVLAAGERIYIELDEVSVYGRHRYTECLSSVFSYH